MLREKELVLAAALALALLLVATPARALTVENDSDAVLYCSVYRQGYDAPLVQFVLLPGKSHQWTPATFIPHPLVVRAMAERRLVNSKQPAVCTVHDHHATVTAGRSAAGLALEIRSPIPVR